jgi:hypothetical protein
MDIEVLVPVSPARIEERPLAPRLDALTGRSIGFLDNQKANAGLLLDRIAADLQERAGPFAAVRQAKVATGPAPTEVMGRLQRCDAVVLAIAD